MDAGSRNSNSKASSRSRSPLLMQASIEAWLAEQPQLTALAIVGRLSEKYPEEFGTKQHSIVQRLLRALRRQAAEQLVTEEPRGDTPTAAPLPRGYGRLGLCRGPTRPRPLSPSKLGRPSGATDQPTSDRQPQ